MASSRRRASKRHHSLSLGLLAFLGIYFLNLCIVNPHVHADVLRQAARARHPSAGHCSLPGAADHERDTVPVCCELMSAGKAISPSPIQLDHSPLLMLASLMPAAGTPTWGIHQLRGVRVRHSSRPPPLYLLHATFLI
jgi:hypothetical protein